MKIFDHYRGLSKGVYIIALSKLVQTMGAFIWPLFTLILSIKVGMEPGLITVFVAAGMFIGVISALVGGVLADKVGSKNTIVIGTSFAISSYIPIMFFEPGMITAFLLMAGMMFFGITGPAHEALMANVTNTDERESAYSLHYLALNIGIIIGPAVGGLLLTNHFNLFIGLDVLTTFLGLLLMIFFVYEDRNKEHENVFEEEVDDSIWKIIKDRPVVIAYGLLGVFISFTYGQLNFTLPLYIKDLFGDAQGTQIYSLLYSFNGFVVVAFTAVITYFFRRRNAMNKMVIGFALYILTMYVLAFTFAVEVFFLMMFVFTLGEIIISVGASPIMSKLVPANILGKISGALTVFYMAGHLASTVLPGVMLERGYSFETVWLTVATVSLIGIVYFMVFRVKYGKRILEVDSLDKNRQ